MRLSVTCIGVGTLILASVLVVTVTQAEVYKWVDDQGVVNYAESPDPNNRDAKKLAVDKTPAPSATQPAETEKAASPADADARYQENLDKLKKSCEESRNNLALLKGDQLVSKVIDGKYVTLNAEQRRAEIESLEKSIAESCTGLQ